MKRNWKGLKQFGHRALREHLLRVAELARAQHGPFDGPCALQALLEDRTCVRYENRLSYVTELAPGLFADTRTHVVDGRAQRVELMIHRTFENRWSVIPSLVVYHIPSINYGRMVTVEDAECFGAAIMGLDRDVYYQRLCEWADELIS